MSEKESVIIPDRAVVTLQEADNVPDQGLEATDRDEHKIFLKEMSEEELVEWLNENNSHNGLHFMPQADAEKYQEMCETDIKAAIKFLKEKWTEYADHEFIQGFALIHWVGATESRLENLDQLLSQRRHEVEISTQGYRDNGSLETNKRWLDAKFGVLIEGEVTLASNADIQTNQWHGPMKNGVYKRSKYTEWANRLMTGEDNCVSPYEFVVGNWRAIGVIVDSDGPEVDMVATLAGEHELPVIDVHDSSLFSRLDGEE